MRSVDEKLFWGLRVGGVSVEGFGMLIAWLFGGVFWRPLGCAVVIVERLKPGSSRDFFFVRMEGCGTPGAGEGERVRSLSSNFASVGLPVRCWAVDDALLPIAVSVLHTTISPSITLKIM